MCNLLQGKQEKLMTRNHLPWVGKTLQKANFVMDVEPKLPEGNSAQNAGADINHFKLSKSSHSEAMQRRLCLITGRSQNEDVFLEESVVLTKDQLFAIKSVSRIVSWNGILKLQYFIHFVVKQRLLMC
mmetsp:Transcript_25354/g.35347  ORF Transcript_25354/g.35347 Transcript_25354/m.35347 type:complete len:128 (+) Transcript_25354:794-1177(+)